MRIWRILLDPVAVEGGGTATTTETQAAAKPPAEAKSPDLKVTAENLVAKHGNETAALLILLGQNKQLEEKVRDLGAKVPAADSIVLSGDHARDWEHYKALGKPSDVKRNLSERDQYKSEADGFRKDVVYRQAAEIHGYKPAVLATLARDVEVVIDVLKDDRGVPVDRAGKVLARDAPPIPAAFVKGDGDKLTRLDLHANAAWKDFIPSLSADSTRPVGTPSTLKNRLNPAAPRGGAAAPETGVPYKSLVR